MRGKLMRVCTREQHIEILNAHPSNKQAAAHYNTLPGYAATPVSERLVCYWRTVFIDHAGKLATADERIKQSRVLRVASPDDDFGCATVIPEVSYCTLVIPDIHAPYHHKDTLPFLVAVRDKFNPDLCVDLGDELDFHALSFHDSDPNLDSAGAELEKAKQFMQKLHREFPDMLVCHSNHGSMVYRRAKAHGIPVQAIKSYREVIFPNHGAPGWSWAQHWTIETPLGPVMFKHQSSQAVSDAAHNSCNVVVGHEHGKFGVEYSASSARLYYGAYAGCLIDKDSMAFAYGKNSMRKPIIGCVVLLNGRPIHIPMLLNSKGRWVGQL